jgi:SPP1 family predicted phage head-tail adaptor
VNASLIGRARERAVLEAKVLTPDGGGGFAEVWEAYATVWARVDVAGGGEPLEAGRNEARLTQRVLIRRRGDVSVNHRVRLGARVLAIRAVVDDGGRALWMTLLCEEGAPS